MPDPRGLLHRLARRAAAIVQAARKAPRRALRAVPFRRLQSESAGGLPPAVRLVAFDPERVGNRAPGRHELATAKRSIEKRLRESGASRAEAARVVHTLCTSPTLNERKS